MVLHASQARASCGPGPSHAPAPVPAAVNGEPRPGGGRWTVARRLLCGLLLLLVAPSLAAGIDPAPNPDPGPAPVAKLGGTKEYELKAAFLYKFIKYTEWPKESFESPKDPIIVELVGKDPFSGKLPKTFQGKKLHGRSFTVRHSVDVPKAVTAHVVFAGKLSDKQRKALLARCKGKAVLLVGDTTGFSAAGAIVNMYLEKGKVRFEINPTAAKASNLKISSQLLKLARIIKPKKEGKQWRGDATPLDTAPPSGDALTFDGRARKPSRNLPRPHLSFTPVSS